MNLGAFLIKPVQRICKYPLLLRELLKNTDDSHPDKESLQKALKAIENIVISINESKKIKDNKFRLQEIEKNLDDVMKLF